MVSGGTVNGDAGSLSSILGSYSSSIGSLSGVWQGDSKTNFDTKTEEFVSSFGNAINSQLTSYATACDKYNEYETLRNEIKNIESQISGAAAGTDTSGLQSQKNEKVSKCETLRSEIANALSSASSPKLEATELKPTFSNAAKGEFVNYYQYNYSDPYSDGTIANSGCGPTSLAMVLTYLLGREITPVETAAKGNGTYTCSEGTYWSYFGDMAQEYGVQCEQMEPSSGNIRDQLNNGKTLILSMGPGDFTSGGHFIVARGLDDNGQLIVADPASEDRTNTVWDVDRVAGQCKQIWAMSN